MAAPGPQHQRPMGHRPRSFRGRGACHKRSCCALAHQSTLAAAEHQHYFYAASATLQVEAGESLFAYVYLDPVNPPSELMLQWSDASWEHRAYWGANLIPWGIDGGAARRYMGALPLSGQWVRLQVPAAQVGLEGSSLNGMAYTLYGGRASWDYAGKTVAGALLPQTISCGAIGNQTLGSAALTLSATASSGLPVSFSSLTAPVCALSANTVTLIAAGTCSIRASQAGNGTYAPAPNVDQSFVISSGQLFAPAISYATGSYPLAVAVADFNGDGKLDVAVINDSSSTVSIFLGAGDGMLHLSVTLFTAIFGSPI